MKKEEFYFDSRDGVTQIHAVKWIPDRDPICIVQIVHGMAEYVQRYERLAQELVQEGILVTGEDHLGHGLSVRKKNGEEGHPYGYFCAHDPATVAVRDVHRLKKIVQEQYPGVPYLILGHSMGSFILRNYLCRYGTGIDAALIMGTGMPARPVVRLAKGISRLFLLLGGSKKKNRLLHAMAFGSYNKRIENPKTPVDWLSTDEAEVAKYAADPLCGFVFTANGFWTLFELLDRLNDRKYLEQMPKDLPVLFLSGEEDPVGDYGAAVRRVAEDFRGLGMYRTQIKLYPGMRHELVNETGREEVLRDILAWAVSYAKDPAKD